MLFSGALVPYSISEKVSFAIIIRIRIFVSHFLLFTLPHLFNFDIPGLYLISAHFAYYHAFGSLTVTGLFFIIY